MNFFDMCEIETSLFDRRYAESNADWLLVKNIYENNVDKEPDGQHGIPKTIHFIWVGSPLPEPYAQNIEDWQNKNPDFIVTHFDADMWAYLIKQDILDKHGNLGPHR